MRIVLGVHSLAWIGGVESYVTTIGDHLQRTGHDVWIYAEEGGASAEIAEMLGLRVAHRTADLPVGVDAVVPQDMPSALELAAALSGVPQVFVSHSDTFDVNVPPQVAGLTRCIVTLYERAHRRMASLSVETPLERLRQPVDVDRFKPTRALPARPRQAVSLGNYLTGARLDLVRKACEGAGLEFRQTGAHAGGLTALPEEALNAADIVFGKAKVVHEAMACGRAVYVLDHNGAEGWVTAENYERLVADNFGGQSEPKTLSVDSLAADLAGYAAAMGIVNRDLAVANHSAMRHAADLIDVIRRHVGDSTAGAGESRSGEVASSDDLRLVELARLARVNWRHEGDAYRLRMQMEKVNAENLELARELDEAQVRISQLERKRRR